MKRGRPHQQGLSAEDRALWQQITEHLTPISEQDRVGTAVSPGDAELFRTSVHAVVDSSDIPEQQQKGPTQKPSAPPLRQSRPPRPSDALDPRLERRIVRGREDIDGRIDLHGMTQAEAHSALRGFLLGAAAKGYRNVLVITGKGRTTSHPDEPWQPDRRETGVLRRSLPGWLASPDLGAVVVEYGQAHLRHGGEGAFYVRLRVRNKGKGKRNRHG